MRRRFIELAAWSALLFVALPLLVKACRGTFTDGVLIGTGVAIVWYTLETLALRKETASLREIGIEQNRIALQQADTAVRPLLVSRIEDVKEYASPISFPRFVLRNIGHGPALFAEIQLFTITVWAKGEWRLEVGRVDLVEPGGLGIPAITPHLVEAQGQIPGYGEIIASLKAADAGGRATAANYDITITYEDVQKRRFESVMQMGMNGTRLLSHRQI